jgi:hypothetical protein
MKITDFVYGTATEIMQLTALNACILFLLCNALHEWNITGQPKELYSLIRQDVETEGDPEENGRILSDTERS